MIVFDALLFPLLREHMVPDRTHSSSRHIPPTVAPSMPWAVYIPALPHLRARVSDSATHDLNPAAGFAQARVQVLRACSTMYNMQWHR